MELLKWILFIEFMKNVFILHMCYIVDLKLIIYTIAVDTEYSTGDSYSPWITN